MTKSTAIIYVFNMFAFSTVYSQQNDTTKVVNLSEVIIKEHQSLGGMERFCLLGCII